MKGGAKVPTGVLLRCEAERTWPMVASGGGEAGAVAVVVDVGGARGLLREVRAKGRPWWCAGALIVGSVEASG